MSRLGYLFAEGFRGIFKHGFMSFASVTIIMACLIIMGSVSLLSVNIDALVGDLEDQNEIVAFVDEDLDDSAAAALQGTILSLDNVNTSQFITRDAAMDKFMSNYDTSLMEGIDSSVFRHRYVIQLNDIANMAQTKRDLEDIPGIVKVNAHLDYAESFIAIRNIITIVSLVLIAMLVFVSFFIMSNTIKLATYSRREEIAIMKMVGASNGFIRFPFVVEGLILGLLGSLLAFVLQWGLYNALCNRLMSSFHVGFLNLVPFGAVSRIVLVGFVGVGVLVGAFGGINAIRNYLKV
ncbi:MAG: permease-like cell division protein FtsX [Oscillospiraceae bacterium]|nr:permease-like cell division protein FtsX [Oscillospiraceae bacterium]